MTTAPGRRSLSASARSAVAPWIVSRGIVLAALAATRFLADHGHLNHHGAHARVSQGLMAWDAGWYEAIAQHGYTALGSQSVRFFPLWPLVVRLLHSTGAPIGWIMGLGASLLWFVALIAVDQLGVASGFSRRATASSLWLVSLVPGAVASVLGYAEPLLVLLIAVALTSVVRIGQRGVSAQAMWMLAIVTGYLAALTRPVGVILCIPLGIEAWKRRAAGSSLLGVVAIVAPVAGLFTYLWWCQRQFGSWLLPLKIQTQAAHHGGLVDPVSGLASSVALATHGHLSVFLHLPWVLVALGMCVLSVRRAPASLTAYSAAIVLVALSGHNLDSFERYLLAAPPLFMVAGTFLESKNLRRGTFVVLGGLLFASAVMAFSNIAVP